MVARETKGKGRRKANQTRRKNSQNPAPEQKKRNMVGTRAFDDEEEGYGFERTLNTCVKKFFKVALITFFVVGVVLYVVKGSEECNNNLQKNCDNMKASCNGWWGC